MELRDEKRRGLTVKERIEEGSKTLDEKREERVSLAFGLTDFLFRIEL